MANRNRDPNVEYQMAHHFTLGDGMILLVPPSEVKPISVLPARVNPFLSSSVQEFPLGTELWYGPRKFRYALCGASAVGVGKLVQSVVPLAGHIDEVINSPAAGATTIDFTPNTVTTDDLAANELADGFIHINDDTGEGYMFQIKSHPAILGGASGTLTLYDPIILTVGDNATATVLHHPLRKFIIHPSPPTAPAVGWTVIPAVANEYCWLQYQGPLAALTDGTLVIGKSVMASDNVDGSVEAWNLTEGTPNVEIQPAIGRCLAVNADTEYSPIWADLP